MIEHELQKAELTKLREAAAAVVEAWSESPFCGDGGRTDQEMTNLRIVAGIKAPPQDGDAGELTKLHDTVEMWPATELTNDPARWEERSRPAPDWEIELEAERNT